MLYVVSSGGEEMNTVDLVGRASCFIVTLERCFGGNGGADIVVVDISAIFIKLI